MKNPAFFNTFKNMLHAPLKGRCLIYILILIFLFLNIFVSCIGKEQTAKNPPSEQENTLVGPGLFRSDKYHLQVQLPSGWAAVEGPELLTSTGHMEGQVSFNSWGQRGFWVREVDRPDGSVIFGDPVDVMAQIPKGGAYVSLLRFGGTGGGPPREPEYLPPPDSVAEDLSNLWQLHDWRQNGAQSKSLFKYGQWLEMWVACRPEASDNIVLELNSLLESWRFDKGTFKDKD